MLFVMDMALESDFLFFKIPICLGTNKEMQKNFELNNRKEKRIFRIIEENWA